MQTYIKPFKNNNDHTQIMHDNFVDPLINKSKKSLESLNALYKDR